MRIKKLILHKFKRFFLSGIETFKYEPYNNLTIISWPNGMGKSSFLSQLNPLPADLKKDFRDGGYKYFEFSYGNDEYILSSGYVSPSKHSFIKNNEELNPGGTSSVQRQLVQEYLVLTPQMNQILLGNEVLTNMSPNIRKQWFTQLSPIDYTYPITVYQNIKTSLRDMIGNVKVTQDEIIKRSKFIIDEKTHDVYLKSIKEIEDIITKLSLGYSKIFKPSNNFNIDKTINDFEKAIELDIKYDKFYNKTEQELLELKGILNQNLKLENEKLNKLDKLLKILDKSKDEIEFKKLKDSLKDLEEYINKNIDSKIDYNIITNCKNDIEEFSKKIRYYLDLLLDSEYRELNVTEETLSNLNKRTEYLREEFNKGKINYGIIEERLKSLNEAKNKNDISCPKCSHTWKVGFDEELLKKTEEEKLDLFNKLKNISDEFKNNTELLNKYKNKFDYINKLKNELNNPLFKIWFTNLDKYDTTDYAFLNILLNKAIQDIDFHYDLLTKIKLKEEQELKIRNIEAAIKAREELQIDSVTKIENDLENTLNQIKNLNNELNDLTLCLNNRNNINELKKTINDYIKYRRTEFKYNVTNKRNDIITEAIGSLKTKLAELSKIINENEGNKKVVESLQELINQNNKDIKTLQVLVKILSPESGLIAKSMNSFLNLIIDDMNTLINQVWTYPMEILPCEIEEDNDLNYKFRVKVNHDEIMEDVSKLSSSQKEIVDLSFKVVFMKYIGLEKYPLFLDEFGKTMDAEHRISAFNVIDKVLTNNFNLTILVCHFESMYTRFVNAQFLELKEGKNDKF